MASRKVAKLRRAVDSRILGPCIAEDCPENAIRRLTVDGVEVEVCEQHALAVEMQERRRKMAQAARTRKETEERLGL